MGRKHRLSISRLGCKTSKDEMPNITNNVITVDSEDEDYNFDETSLNIGPEFKRRKKRQNEDEVLELSDHEILADPDSNSDSECSDGLVDEDLENSDNAFSETHDTQNEETYEDFERWGASKNDYYNHDIIETETDALQEEAEAKRIQQKKLGEMSEADFGLDEDELLYNGDENRTGNVVREVLKDIEITPDIEPQERLRILQMRYPEFEPLANDLLELYPVLQQLQSQVEAESLLSWDKKSEHLIEFRALSAYVGALTMYFAIISSPGHGSTGQAQALNPTELQEHPIMDSLLKCRELWLKTKSISQFREISMNLSDDPVHKLSSSSEPNTTTKPKKISKESKRKMVSVKDTKSEVMKDDTEEKLQELTMSLNMTHKKKAKAIIHPEKISEELDDSDFGEEEFMDVKSAMEKAQKKKSLRFYTSQITQKANKSMGANRNIGGDEDIPHRERFRDRQTRLVTEAQRRANRNIRTSLSEGSDTEENVITEQVRNNDNEYYNLVSHAAKQKRDQKRVNKEAKVMKIVEEERLRQEKPQISVNGKRAIGYMIEKNKGLTPKRKKDVRNPRVKKRKKFEEKKKKLASIRAVYKGGEDFGGYGGEKTGIKTTLVKSIKL